ncbi:uncharacterized protein EDB93DRAFT_1109335 [Suillus bovinus]|uniref:uncharacterized protein n=1 Tax=Suillus bovinus TaxID=48563 RepID=UPI001B87D46C|nr:uncharacterized protein EDB93DRAFT_1109335 [Suillus bovinus]KAG2127263.1 hypothetical protein EDB93DRAFT_1109335 [Suillus bovinus]
MRLLESSGSTVTLRLSCVLCFNSCKNYCHLRLEPRAPFRFLQNWLFALFKKPSNPAPTLAFVLSALTILLSALAILLSALASASSANASALIAASAQTVTSPHLIHFAKELTSSLFSLPALRLFLSNFNSEQLSKVLGCRLQGSLSNFRHIFSVVLSAHSHKEELINPQDPSADATQVANGLWVWSNE